MNKKVVKIILILITMMMILFVIQKIIKTYALFQSELYGTLEMQNADWIIKVNGRNISSGTVNEFVVNQINMSSNEHVKSGKIAPSMIGDFSITIDPEDTDVSLRYDITIDKSKITNSRILITSVTEIEKNNTLILTEEDTYTGVIPLENIRNGDKNKIKVVVTWLNEESNNEQDTQIGIGQNSKIEIPIVVRVTQYLGETITQYVP
jgi:hypothetical protein